MRPYVILALALLASLAYAAPCSFYATEPSCTSNKCFSCERCSGKQINSYDADRCIESSLNCTYSCSTICDADCEANADCKINLTDTDCYYSGVCSSCKCAYQRADCPKPGTLQDGICYYGDRFCTSSGCTISKCVLNEGQICDPENGCVSCGQAECGSQGEYIEEYRCVGDELHAKKVLYFCNATSCHYTKTEGLAERCKNGCFDGKCRDELCNIYGVQTNCNIFDAFYGERFCKGSDIYGTYRDYSCGTNECVFVSDDRKIDSCEECQAGRCTDPGQIVYTNSNYTLPAKTPDAPIITNQTNATLPAVIYPGKRLYSGIFFGSNELNIPAKKGSGHMNLTIASANKLGMLVIKSGDYTILRNRLGRGTYSVSFGNLQDDIRIYTESSWWVFFMPSVYDIASVSFFGE